MSLLRYYSDILVPLFVTVHTLTLATTVTKSRLSLSLCLFLCACLHLRVHGTVLLKICTLLHKSLFLIG